MPKVKELFTDRIVIELTLSEIIQEQQSRNAEIHFPIIFQGIQIGVAIESIGVGTDLSIQGWQNDMTFSATDADTVAWTSGTITMRDGTTFSIDAGNTGNISASTYIYFDKNTSETVLQTTTTASDAVGANKILIAFAKNSTQEANFQVFGGSGGFIAGTANLEDELITTAKLVDAAVEEAKLATDSVVAAKIKALAVTTAKINALAVTTEKINANAVTAAKIAANTITASEIAAGTITATEIAANTITANEIAANTITATEINVSQLSAIAADMGAITAGVITLDSAGNIKSVQTDFNTGGKGWFLGWSGGAPKLSMGDSADPLNQLLWDDTDLSINGSRVTGIFLYGSGADGDATISSNTDLTEDKYYDNLTINTGITLNTKGYKVFVKGTLTLTGTAKIGRIGNAGGNGGNGNNGEVGAGGAGSAGAAGASGAAGTLPGFIVGELSGGAGSGNNTTNHNGTAGNAGDAIGNRAMGVVGGTGVEGGDGGDGLQGGGNAAGGQNGGAVTSTSIVTRPISLPQAIFYADYDPQASAGTTEPYQGSSGTGASSGGGGGGGDTGDNTHGGGGGGGGGSGSPGGTIIVCARRIEGDGSVTVKGGAGGNAGNGGNGQQAVNERTGGGGGGSGGTGGPGGVLIAIYNYKDSGITLDRTGGVGGSAGTKGSPGANGTDNAEDGSTGSTGPTGTLIELQN